VRLELENLQYQYDSCETFRRSVFDCISTTAVSWKYAQALGESGLGQARLENLRREEQGGELAFIIVQAGWHLRFNFLTPAQVLYRKRLRADTPGSRRGLSTALEFPALNARELGSEHNKSVNTASTSSLSRHHTGPGASADMLTPTDAYLYQAGHAAQNYDTHNLCNAVGVSARCIQTGVDDAETETSETSCTNRKRGAHDRGPAFTLPRILQNTDNLEIFRHRHGCRKQCDCLSLCKSTMMIM
jgi:hypothetical protein